MDMSGCPSQSFINRDYINPTDGRPMVSGANQPIVGRLSADSRPIFCPILEEKNVGRRKKPYSIILFSSADSFEVLVSGLTSADRRPTIDNRPTSNEK